LNSFFFADAVCRKITGPGLESLTPMTANSMTGL
jgi:hypothetical protein